MNNRDTRAARQYHDSTKHSYSSIRTNPHYLDWENRPRPFKIYPKLAPIPLPQELPQTGIAALSAISQVASGSNAADAIPSLEDLARILYFSAGITRHHANPEIYFRAASCTGALYEIELYLVTRELPGLAAGVYHFNPADVSLRQLRAGDFRGNLARATATQPAVRHAPTTIICTGTYWRNAWKYQARTYRHFGWDNGTLLANTLAICAASGLPAEIVLGFVDAEINSLLDLDTRREVSLCLVPIGRESAKTPPPAVSVSALNLETISLSKSEVEYPAMLEMHAASSIESAQEVQHWREAIAPRHVSSPTQAADEIPLTPLLKAEQPSDNIEEVILRRGSTRTFDKSASITFAQLSTILESSTRGLPADFAQPPGAQLNDLYLIVHSVEGLAPGSYFFNRERNTLQQLKSGDLRAEAYYLGLQQELPAFACVDIFFLADLNPILERFGSRGYRAVQLEAGAIGGKMYLAAYAQHLGATGLTFFDDDVTNFFSPHAANKSAIFLMAIGKPKHRNSK